MRNIDLDELYVEYYYSKYCEPYECEGFIIATEYAKPLKELLQEFLDLEIVDDGTNFNKRGDWPWSEEIISPDEHKYLQQIMDGEITEYEVDDDSSYRAEVPSIWLYTESPYEYMEHHLAPLKEVVEYNKMVKSEWAREQGIMPPKTWYREEVDRIVYQSTHPYDIDVDDLPF